MLKKELSKFCSNKIGLVRIDHPWSVGDKTYVTNGFVLLRLPRFEDVPENKDAPDVSKLFETFPFPSGGWHPLPDLPELEYEDRDGCRGTGKRKTKDGPIDCNECGGKGVWFMVSFLMFIKENLPGLEFSINKMPESPSWIRFEGGDGLIMPCRQEENHEYSHYEK